jgi:hypothetical protein
MHSRGYTRQEDKAARDAIVAQVARFPGSNVLWPVHRDAHLLTEPRVVQEIMATIGATVMHIAEMSTQTTAKEKVIDVLDRLIEVVAAAVTGQQGAGPGGQARVFMQRWIDMVPDAIIQARDSSVVAGFLLSEVRVIVRYATQKPPAGPSTYVHAPARTGVRKELYMEATDLMRTKVAAVAAKHCPEPVRLVCGMVELCGSARGTRSSIPLDVMLQGVLVLQDIVYTMQSMPMYRAGTETNPHAMLSRVAVFLGSSSPAHTYISAKRCVHELPGIKAQAAETGGVPWPTAEEVRSGKADAMSAPVGGLQHAQAAVAPFVLHALQSPTPATFIGVCADAMLPGGRGSMTPAHHTHVKGIVAASLCIMNMWPLQPSRCAAAAVAVLAVAAGIPCSLEGLRDALHVPERPNDHIVEEVHAALKLMHKCLRGVMYLPMCRGLSASVGVPAILRDFDAHGGMKALQVA